MDDVASAAGVSTSTVSRALQDHPRIPPETKERVLEAAVELGYRTNPLVSALMAQLRQNKPPSAVCNLAWLDFFREEYDWKKDPVHASFYKGACQRATLLGYSIDRISCRRKDTAQLDRTLRNRGIRGVLLPAFDGDDGLARKIPLSLKDLNVVGVGTRFEDPFLNYASDDQFESARLAVKKLWSLGYRKIGYTGTARVESIVKGRFLAGYQSSLQFELKEIPVEPIISDQPEILSKWISEHELDAVISASRSSYLALQKTGYVFPKDLALVHLNLDEIPFSSENAVAGIRQENEEVGSAAAQLLIDLLNDNALGIPLHPRGIQILGSWSDGTTAPPRESI